MSQAVSIESNVSIKKYFLKGGAWAFGGRVLTALMGLALSAMLARMLSPGDMGAYFLAFNIATFLAIFARMGLENTLLRFISEAMGRKQPGRARAVIKKGILLAFLGAAVVGVGFYAGLGGWLAKYLFHSMVLGAVVGFIAIWIILLAFQSLFAEIFRGFQDIRAAVLFGGLLTAGGTTVMVALYWFIIAGHLTLNQVLPWVLAAGAINIALAIWVLKPKFHVLAPSRTETVSYRELADHSWPLLFSTLTFAIMAQSDLWILAAFRSDQEVAIYGAATRLVAMTGMVLAIVNAVVPPLIARLNVQNQKERLERILRTTATLAAIPALMALLVFTFFGDEVLGLLFGAYYRSGATILVILSVGQAVSVCVGSCGITLMMMGHQRTLLIISIVSALVSVSSGFIWVQMYGATGVAMATTVAMVLQQILMLFFARYRCEIWTHAGLGFTRDFRKLKEAFVS